MKILVEANHKYIDEIQTVAQVFFPHARFGSAPEKCAEEYKYTIASYIENDKVYAELFAADVSLGKRVLNLSDKPVYLNDKRLAMLAVYHLLQDIIGAYTPWGALTGVRPTKMVREWMADGKTDDDIIWTLQGTFCVHEDRARLVVEVAHGENHVAGRMKMLSIAQKSSMENSPVGIYISVPFCPSRCIYCSFNTENKRWNAADQARYVEAVAIQCGQVAGEIRDTGRHVSSIYVGGGTPTALTNEMLESLLSTINNKFKSNAEHLEYTVEAGRPDTITQGNLRLMRSYGVNRISINPQTFNNRTLEIIGRNHTVDNFNRAFNAARAEGFACINTDIIAGLPGEGPEDMHRTMEALAPLAPENITIHTLAIKRASKLNELRTEHSLTGYAIPEADIIKAQLQIAHEGCTEMGLSPYYLYRQKNMAALFENTGYSLPGHECLYNVGMMSEVQTVYGIGAGAVSKFINGNLITRKFNVKNPEIYIQRMLSNQ